VAVRSLLGKWLISWLNAERTANDQTFCNFKQLSSEIRPCDVLLVEGRTRASQIIKTLTQSIWTHSAIYIGRLSDIQDAGATFNNNKQADMINYKMGYKDIYPILLLRRQCFPQEA
jgi:hypothetical protein